SETTIPFGLLCLAEQLVFYSVPANAFARLRLFANTVSTAPFKATKCCKLPSEAQVADSSRRSHRRGKADGGSDVAGVVVVFLLLCWVVGSIAMWLVGFIVNLRQDGDGAGAAREQGVVRRAPPQVRRARRRNPSALLRHAPPIVTRKESRRTVSAGDEAARARSRRKSKGGLPERKSLLPISNRRPASLLRKMRIRRPEDGAPGIGIVLAMALPIDA
ncbi:hypothetical protein GW17_00038258, partial [Ensete ventricosum]